MNLLRRKRIPLNRFLFLTCLGFLILCSECGKKAPPVVPEATVPPAVKNLEAEIIGDKVRLTWSVPKRADKAFDGLGHFGVYKYKSHISAKLCTGCPIPFKHFLDVNLDDPEQVRVEGDRIVCHDDVEADHRYAYKVVVYHKSGGVSEDSNIVQFVVKPNN